MKEANHYPINYRNLIVFSLFISLLINIFYILIYFLGVSALDNPKGIPPHYAGINIFFLLYSFFSTFLYTFIISIINSHLIKIQKGSQKQFLNIILFNILATLILSFLFSQANMLLFDRSTVLGRFFLGNFIRNFLISLVTIFLTQFNYLQYKKQQIALEYEKLSAENIKTRYEALKNQINPHFLFNCLGTLKSLIRLDPEKAEDYVQKFSNVLRYTIQDKDLLPLKDELEFTSAYCELMLIRYGENLSFDFRIDEKYYHYPIIPISLQTLVENAIKHNVISEKLSLTVHIYTTDDEKLCVSNLIQSKKMKEPGVGIGLKNLNERYMLRFKRAIVITQTENKFIVSLPLTEL